MTNSAILAWIASKPGPFSGRTHDVVWDMAWKNFCAGPTGGLANQVKFMTQMMQAGYGIRTSKLGGCILDRVT